MLERILKETLPMTGRMVHGVTASGDDTEQSQNYDVHGRVGLTNTQFVPY
jgi:kynurenine 3-monooxygenase